MLWLLKESSSWVVIFRLTGVYIEITDEVLFNLVVNSALIPLIKP